MGKGGAKQGGKKNGGEETGKTGRRQDRERKIYQFGKGKSKRGSEGREQGTEERERERLISYQFFI